MKTIQYTVVKNTSCPEKANGDPIHHSEKFGSTLQFKPGQKYRTSWGHGAIPVDFEVISRSPQFLKIQLVAPPLTAAGGGSFTRKVRIVGRHEFIMPLGSAICCAPAVAAQAYPTKNMKTTIQVNRTSIPDFSGIVIDPETGRKCALQVDIFRGLNLAGCQVMATKARIYQRRFVDLQDVLDARAKTGRKGQNRGIILIQLVAAMAAALCGSSFAVATLRGVSNPPDKVVDLARIESLETLNKEEF